MQIRHPNPDIILVSVYMPVATRAGNHHTRFVPLCSVQIESPISTRSPSENGDELPLAMADATADLRKSMIVGALVGHFGGSL